MYMPHEIYMFARHRREPEMECNLKQNIQHCLVNMPFNEACLQIKAVQGSL